VFEQVFGKPFPRTRPDWLTAGRLGRLELDGYCKALLLAFEYQGRQHYEPGVFAEGLPRIQERDRLKAELCSGRGVKLVVVPQIPNDMLYDAAKATDWILGSVGKAGVDMPEWDQEGFDPIRLTQKRSDLENLRLVGCRLDMELLDDIWRGVDFVYTWRCLRCGSLSRSNADNRRRGKRCKACFLDSIRKIPGVSLMLDFVAFS